MSGEEYNRGMSVDDYVDIYNDCSSDDVLIRAFLECERFKVSQEKIFYVYDRFNKKEKYVIKAYKAEDALQKLINQKNATGGSKYIADDFVIRELAFEDDIVQL